MTITRSCTEFAKRIFYDRLGDDYDYGGTFDPADIKVGADCSGLVTDELGALFFGTAMHWDREGLSTESYRYKPLGPQRVGPFDLVHVAALGDIPPDAAAIVNLHHEGEGGPHSHMNVIVDGIYMEESGTWGCCTAPKAIPAENTYWNDHWYVPGPIVEDGTPRTEAPAPMTESPDTLFADVSEFQVPVTDAYTAATYQDAGQSFPFRWLSIRSNDGGHRDQNFAQNYAWCVKACDDGRLAGFFVYFYWRPGATDVDTHMAMVTAAGGPHPRMASMMDIESGGNPGGDQSAELTAEYHKLAAWLGDQRRVIAYANLGDEKSMWQFKPANVPFILAGYGANPSDPTVVKLAHQYTDGNGYGGGLPEGAPPFGHCDMNSADGFTPSQLAAACGMSTTTTPPLTEEQMADIVSLAEQVRAKQDGVAPGDLPDGTKKGQPLPYCRVSQDRPRTPLDEPPNQVSTPSQGDHLTHITKQLTGRLWLDDTTALGLWDMLALYVLNLVEAKGLPYVKQLIAQCPQPPSAAMAAREASDDAGSRISWDTD